jgi:xylulokinase
MSGERITDRCDAAGTQLLDQARREWSEEVLAACGVDPAWQPRLAVTGESPEAVCRSPEFAAALPTTTMPQQ